MLQRVAFLTAMYFTTCVASSGTRLCVGLQLTGNLRLVPKHRLGWGRSNPVRPGSILASLYVGGSLSPRATLIRDRVLLEQGKQLTIDEAQLRRQAIDAAARIYQMNAPGCDLAARFEQVVATVCIGLASEPPYYVPLLEWCSSDLTADEHSIDFELLDDFHSLRPFDFDLRRPLASHFQGKTRRILAFRTRWPSNDLWNPMHHRHARHVDGDLDLAVLDRLVNAIA